MNKNQSHLAGEFLVAGELSRRGMNVSITFGNAKSVDIFAELNQKVYRIDAKAIKSKTNWPISVKQVGSQVIYIFVFLGSKAAIYKSQPPEYFLVKGRDILSKNLVTTWNNRSGIEYKSLNMSTYKDAWDIFK